MALTTPHTPTVTVTVTLAEAQSLAQACEWFEETHPNAPQTDILPAAQRMVIGIFEANKLPQRELTGGPA